MILKNAVIFLILAMCVRVHVFGQHSMLSSNTTDVPQMTSTPHTIMMSARESLSTTQRTIETRKATAMTVTPSSKVTQQTTEAHILSSLKNTPSTVILRATELSTITHHTPFAQKSTPTNAIQERTAMSSTQSTRLLERTIETRKATAMTVTPSPIVTQQTTEAHILSSLTNTPSTVILRATELSTITHHTPFAQKSTPTNAIQERTAMSSTQSTRLLVSTKPPSTTQGTIRAQRTTALANTPSTRTSRVAELQSNVQPTTVAQELSAVTRTSSKVILSVIQSHNYTTQSHSGTQRSIAVTRTSSAIVLDFTAIPTSSSMLQPSSTIHLASTQQPVTKIPAKTVLETTITFAVSSQSQEAKLCKQLQNTNSSQYKVVNQQCITWIETTLKSSNIRVKLKSFVCGSIFGNYRLESQESSADPLAYRNHIASKLETQKANLNISVSLPNGVALIVTASSISVDVNECEGSIFPCDSNAVCRNAIGSYSCTCRSGYEGSGTNCKKVTLTKELIIIIAVFGSIGLIMVIFMVVAMLKYRKKRIGKASISSKNKPSSSRSLYRLESRGKMMYGGHGGRYSVSDQPSRRVRVTTKGDLENLKTKSNNNDVVKVNHSNEIIGLNCGYDHSGDNIFNKGLQRKFASFYDENMSTPLDYSAVQNTTQS